MKKEMEEMRNAIINEFCKIIESHAASGEQFHFFNENVETLLIDNIDPRTPIIVNFACGRLTALQAKAQIDRLKRLKAFW